MEFVKKGFSFFLSYKSMFSTVSSLFQVIDWFRVDRSSPSEPGGCRLARALKFLRVGRWTTLVIINNSFPFDIGVHLDVDAYLPNREEGERNIYKRSRKHAGRQCRARAWETGEKRRRKKKMGKSGPTIWQTFSLCSVGYIYTQKVTPLPGLSICIMISCVCESPS